MGFLGITETAIHQTQDSTHDQHNGDHLYCVHLDSSLAVSHATAPNNAPTPAVSTIAIAPQKVTRNAPMVTPAPPTCAANPPNNARNTSDVPATRKINPPAGAIALTNRGKAAPTAKLPADANAA